MATGAPLRRFAISTRCLFHPNAAEAHHTSLARLQSRPASRLPQCHSQSQSRQISSSPRRRDPETDTERGERPRWQQTPRGMSMPVRIRSKPKNNEWTCNSDPRKLDAMYVRLLGEGGDKLLSEEVKWLAVTHKSYDQGRRGFNDRLSYLGRRIVELQTSMALVSAPRNPTETLGQDEWNRLPFEHPALEGLGNLSERTKSQILDRTRLAQLAMSQGVDRVMRWKPRRADNLIGSGQETVLAQAMYGIVGALALERGGELANRVAREKILEPLGVVL